MIQVGPIEFPVVVKERDTKMEEGTEKWDMKCSMKRTWPAAAGFADGGRGHDPGKAGSL